MWSHSYDTIRRAQRTIMNMDFMASCIIPVEVERIMLEWNVYLEDFNSGEIKVWNIFNHWSFYDACLKARKKFKEDKEAFANDIKGWLRYFFWAKCEYEIILDHWPSGEWYELRNDVTTAELKKMYEQAGLKFDSWRINEKNADKKLIIKIFPDENRFRQKKIDVCQQVENNWDRFIDYVWENRKELKARKI